MERHEAMTIIQKELNVALAKHPTFQTHHHGYAVILEELDELWDAVKHDDHGQALKEVAQIGAMVLRYMIDLYPLKEKEQP